MEQKQSKSTVSVIDDLLNLTIKNNDLLTFISDVNERMQKLIELGEPNECLNCLIYSIILNKLPDQLRKEFKNTCSDDKMPRFDLFINFFNKKLKEIAKENHEKKNETVKLEFFTKCPKCGNNHSLEKCRMFLDLNASDRLEMVEGLGVCVNCLQHKEENKSCFSCESCSVCGENHHTLCHRENTVQLIENTNDTVLQPTAIIRLVTGNESPILARALLDTGSSCTCITKSMALRLEQPIHNDSEEYLGIGGNYLKVIGETFITLVGKINKKVTIKCQIVDKLEITRPSKKVSIEPFEDIDLADPFFNEPTRIDILLGVNAYNEIILDDRIHRPGELTAQNTIFGWVISGVVP